MSAGPSSARPTSLKRTILPSTSLMIRLLNSSAVCIRPRVRIVSSVVFPSTLPDGNSTFSLSTAFLISIGVMPYPDILIGSSHKRIEYFFSPQMLTPLTSLIVWSCSLTVRSAISLNSRSERLSLCNATIMIGRASASAFDTIGGSQSLGRKRCARETLSRTSLAAVSKSTESSNSTVMRQDPCWLTLDRERMPGIPLMFCSRGSVIWFSITSALAPAYEHCTEIMGLSTEGYSLTPKEL